MSRRLVSRSSDLERLQQEGYDLEIRGANLLVRVPYVNADKQVASGILVSELTTSGDETAPPGTHVVTFVGETENDLPCDDAGGVLDDLINQRGPVAIGDELVGSCTFSHKPDPTYPDYYEKMSTYADMLVGYAQAIDPSATAKTFPPIATDDDESVFRYFDSATSRARIGAVTDKLRLSKVAIVGLGGTGSYILDLVAKAPVEQVDIYDSDVMLTHNAFRSPGAASLEELRERPHKVRYLQAKYDSMHRNVIAHPYDIDAANVEELRDAEFVFLSIDAGPDKRVIIQRLQEFNVPFADTGIGVYRTRDSLAGIVRTTTSVPGHTDHVIVNLTFEDEVDAEYDDNIQIADLNMLNAALAVMRFKRHFGFYADLEHEHSSYYTIDGNHLVNADHDGAA
jgi:hypothetical protein